MTGRCSLHAAIRPAIKCRHSTGSAPLSALRTQPAEYELAFANDPFSEGTRARLRHVIPLHIFDVAAPVTDEVMMPHVFCIESRGAALNRHFAHQSGFY